MKGKRRALSETRGTEKNRYKSYTQEREERDF